MQNERIFSLDEQAGYFRRDGVDVMAFSDFYPAGHQSGVCVIMHGRRIATNGDVRFEPTPGQWQPLPKQEERTLLPDENAVVTRLSYPDERSHLKGFNPALYPDFDFSYQVRVQGAGDAVEVTVDLDKPIPERFAGKLCFNLELYPGDLFGKPWIMDDCQGIFPRQPNGPLRAMPSNVDHSAPAPDATIRADKEWLTGHGHGYSPAVADDLVAEPYAEGRCFTLCPDDPYTRLTVETLGSSIRFFDGRMNHNNGWFVLSEALPADTTAGAIRWVIRPNAVPGWRYQPVVQVSQVGYHPAQPKVAVVELDRRDETNEKAVLVRIGARGEETVCALEPKAWGTFLRYRYLQFDFTQARETGLYRVDYCGSSSAVFRIAEDVYDRGVWQPVLEYFLPVQMCHMRVSEKYRVWHALCHHDDARMAPLNHNHFDGYFQGPSTLTKYQPGDHVPGLNAGGWHDAGDFDLRVESQAGESYILTCAYEAFQVDYDATTIDQQRQVAEIHQPDGKNDILQQIEHGLLTVVGGYKALGRLYRGIICNDLRQYVMLGDASAMTAGVPGDEDDRWVFTEDNPWRELNTAAQLAACARAMRGFNDQLGADALQAARELYEVTRVGDLMAQVGKLHAAAELLITTGEDKYRAYLLEHVNDVCEHPDRMGWIAAKVTPWVKDAGFEAAVRGAMEKLQSSYAALSQETPYGIPYKPHIWGAGWEIQRLGFQYYYMHRAFPDLFPAEMLYSALNFILGCHPGSNTASFASGVGAKSATVAYCAYRADWSYIPGGVVSGTALIRPDLPELLEFPFLWQQTEYVLGGGSSNYMFLVLAARQLLGR